MTWYADFSDDIPQVIIHDLKEMQTIAPGQSSMEVDAC